MTFGKRLTQLREENGYNTRKKFAEKLSIPETTLRNYETDAREPGHTFLKQMSDFFNVSADYLLGLTDEKEKFSSHQLKSSEIDHIKKYRSLDPHGKEMVDFTLLKEWERSTAEPKPESKPSSPTAQIIPMRFLSYYQRMASAGRGEYLFSDIPTEVIPVPDTPLSRRADFVIGVSGRSMEDTYFDGDKVLVEKTQDVPLGKIGIFIRGDECFIKEAGKNRLISHNEDKEQYPDIIPDDRRIDTIGIVLGKVGD